MEQLAAALEKGGIPKESLAQAFKVGRAWVHRLTVPGTEAIPTWKRLRKLVESAGHWPVLLGTDEDLELLEENFEDMEGKTPAKIVQQAEKVDPAALFDDWQETAVENCHAAAKDFEDDDKVREKYERMAVQEAPFQGLPRGDWPDDAEPSDDFLIPYDVLTKKPLESVYVGLVPTVTCWEVPAFLKFGSWNACPHPEHHVAIMRYWHGQYGAEVVGITHDIVEMLVARPPRSRKRALELAREQYLYCEDIVDQGTRTLDNLAATLLYGESWYFWWD